MSNPNIASAGLATRVKPGQVLNPGGVAKQVAAVRRLLVEEDVEAAHAKLRSLLASEEPEDVRFAIQMIFAYTLGKPKPVDSESDLANELQAIVTALRNRLDAPSLRALLVDVRTEVTHGK